MESNSLQSILHFLYECSAKVSSSNRLPHQYICDFIQYLHHFAQLGILDEPQILSILIDLHKAKDENNITIETFKMALEHIKTVHYLYAYKHLNLIEFDKFLKHIISDGKRK